jgi:glycosyltransferase involved in cell wall biosynthesis
VPAVVSAVDGLPEDVTHGRDGWLVEAGDAGALGNGLGRLTADGPARARIGREARRTFERRFASARLVEALAREYGRLGLPPAVTARESSPR